MQDWTKEFDELTFSDDFMFGKTMEDKELCRAVIECLLQRPVGELEDVIPQKEFRYTSDGKPIKLDIYTQSDREIYDAEMQNLGNKTVKSLHLPRRMRFYQSSIDTDYLYKGRKYKTLPDSNILFICTFDPFGKGLSTYTFRESCKEDPGLLLNDGTSKILYNCTYKGDDIPDSLRRLYEYIETGKATDSLTRKIDKAVTQGRRRDEWRSAYMKERLLMEDMFGDEIDEYEAKLEEANARAEEARKETAEARQGAAAANARADEAVASAKAEKTRADEYRKQLIEAGITPREV